MAENLTLETKIMATLRYKAMPVENGKNSNQSCGNHLYTFVFFH